MVAPVKAGMEISYSNSKNGKNHRKIHEIYVSDKDSINWPYL